MTGARLAEPAAVSLPPPRSAVRRFLFALGVLALLCLFSAPLYVDDIATDSPVPHLGQVSYAGWKGWDHPVSLAGDWRLVWRSPSLPGGPSAGNVAVVRVPGVWSGAPVLGRPGVVLPRWGLASYELTLHGVPPGAYTLFVPTIPHASRVWVNGRLAGATGQVGETPASTRYQWRAQRIAIDADGSDLRLGVDVAAFHHFSDGLDGPPTFGKVQVMEGRLAKESAQQLFFIVTLIILFFYGAIVFAFRRRDYPSLFFALACVSLVPTAMVIGHDDLLTLFYPALSFPAHMAVEYLTCIVTFMCLLAYTALLFPRENARVVFAVFEGLLGVSLVVVGVALALGDTVVASYLDRYPLFLAMLELAYIVGVVFLATLRRRDGAAVFLLGMSVFAASIVEAILVQYDIVPQDKAIGYAWAPMGLLIFAVSHIIILAERWSLAMEATETMASDLRRLMEISSSVTSEIRLDALLKNVVEATSRFLNADRGALFLHEPKTDELRSVVAEGLGTREIRIAADAGIAGASFRDGEACLVEDAYADPRFNRAVDEATGYRTRSMLTLPIVTRDGRRLGVMQALNRRDGRPFGEADIDRMRAFAAHAAVALHNATLFSEIVAARNYNDSILASMSGGVITLNEDGEVETVNPAAAAILEVDAALIRGLAARSVLVGPNAWLLAEFDAVREEGDARALLDVEVETGAGRTISVNVSVVPLINEGASAGLLVLFEDISQEKRLKGAMRRFMTQKVVDQVMQREDDLMFGAACVASVLFADIRGFTSMAENLEARETVNMLNEVFADLVEAVSGHDGVVDKFIGDAVMAVFGAPLTSGRDPQNAALSANAMMTMVEALNRRRLGRDQPPLRLGVGVATGELIAGTIGSPKRMDYTVIGDSVNLASRLQDLTKHYKVGVIVCEATARANADSQVLRRLDTVVIRGRNRPERIFQLMTYHTEETFPRLAEVLAAYERGLACLDTEDWRAAADAFAAALALNADDHPSELMLARARAGLASRAESWSDAGWSTPPVVSAP
ncbi:MAG: cyaB 2 [Caulobacteraceae bacterium]|nr:cyaB 2 [Caulobacteraceae bacterium]